MASIPIHSSRLGLYESQINEPTPLRISKHCQTFSSSSTFHEPFSRRVRPTHQSLDDKESPPLAADRPLTIQKLRKNHKRNTIERAESYGSLADDSTMFNDSASKSLGKSFLRSSNPAKMKHKRTW
jgi:hypothetical protein